MENLSYALMLLPTALRNLWKHQVLLFIVGRKNSPIKNKVLDREFYWSADFELQIGLVCEKVNNIPSLRKKHSFIEGFFSQARENSQDEGIDTKFSHQKLPWISCAVT